MVLQRNNVTQMLRIFNFIKSVTMLHKCYASVTQMLRTQLKIMKQGHIYR